MNCYVAFNIYILNILKSIKHLYFETDFCYMNSNYIFKKNIPNPIT